MPKMISGILHKLVFLSVKLIYILDKFYMS